MISDKKLLNIVEKLLVKAKADEVRWQRDGPNFDEFKVFAVQFKGSTLSIQYLCPPTELDEIEIRIENNEAATIARVSVKEDDGDPRWRLFLDLYREAERKVLGSDRVLSEIEEELQKEGAIGLP